jgi:hypothetical protein
LFLAIDDDDDDGDDDDDDDDDDDGGGVGDVVVLVVAFIPLCNASSPARVLIHGNLPPPVFFHLYVRASIHERGSRERANFLERMRAPLLALLPHPIFPHKCGYAILRAQESVF